MIRQEKDKIFHFIAIVLLYCRFKLSFTMQQVKDSFGSYLMDTVQQNPTGCQKSAIKTPLTLTSQLKTMTSSQWKATIQVQIGDSSSVSNQRVVILLPDGWLWWKVIPAHGNSEQDTCLHSCTAPVIRIPIGMMLKVSYSVFLQTHLALPQR